MTSSVQNRWAFLVGVNQYEEPSAGALSYCAKDVAALAKLLDQADYKVVCLHDEVTDKALLPTHTRIKGRLSGLKGQFGPDDLLLVYFACHGTRHGDGLPRLMVADTWRSQLAESAIAHLPPNVTLVITSDHGNVEDISTKRHTLNALPF